jgi:hypothetical protein
MDFHAIVLLSGGAETHSSEHNPAPLDFLSLNHDGSTFVNQFFSNNPIV